MFIRKYWIPLSVFILAIAGVGFYLLATRPPKDPIMIYKAVEPLPKSTETEKPTAQAPIEETDTGGHFHTDGTWHDEPHASVDEVPLSPEDTQTLATIDWENLTPNEIMYLLNEQRWPHLTQAQRETVHHEFYAQSLGVEPPPEGYYYRVQANGHPVLDENGKPRLFKEGEPIITVKKGIGFAPTREQYKQYKELVAKHDRAYLAGNTAEAARIDAQIEELRAEARGEVPIVTSSLIAPTSQYAAARAAANLKINEISDQAYRDMGLGYMVDED